MTVWFHLAWVGSNSLKQENQKRTTRHRFITSWGSQSDAGTRRRSDFASPPVNSFVRLGHHWRPCPLLKIEALSLYRLSTHTHTLPTKTGAGRAWKHDMSWHEQGEPAAGRVWWPRSNFVFTWSVAIMETLMECQRCYHWWLKSLCLVYRPWSWDFVMRCLWRSIRLKEWYILVSVREHHVFLVPFWLPVCMMLHPYPLNIIFFLGGGEPQM